MIFNLGNGDSVELPDGNVYGIFFGPNAVGKTQMTAAIKNAWKEKTVFVFDEEFVKSSFGRKGIIKPYARSIEVKMAELKTLWESAEQASVTLLSRFSFIKCGECVVSGSAETIFAT